MRGIIYCVVLGLLLFAPVERLDIADLEPVGAVAAYREGTELVLVTDTGDQGRGLTALQALEDMKKRSATVIYLDTADVLLVSEDALDAVEEVGNLLKRSVRVGNYTGGSVEEAAKYAKIHGGLTKMRKWEKNDRQHEVVEKIEKNRK